MSDRPTVVDTLGFEPFVEAVYEHLTDPTTSTPVTLSIEGEWGGGKSSFMMQLRDRIDQKSPWDYIVWFNAWRHDKGESVWAAFAVEFIRQLNLGHWKKRNWLSLLGHCQWLRNFLNAFFRSKHPICRFVRWLGRCWPVWLLGFCIYCMLPPTWISVMLWLYWKIKVTVKLALRRFDWDKGWWDFLKTACLLGLWVTLMALGIYLWLRQDSGAGTEASGFDLWPEWLKQMAPWFSGIIGLLGTALTVTKKFTGNPMRYDLRKYYRRPDYDDRIAFIEKFHADFNRVVSAMVGHHKVYVFIDDLDRCDVPKAADLMQALNLMIPDGRDISAELVYILGIDQLKIAAGLAAKFKDVTPYLVAANDKSSLKVETSESDQKASHERRALHFGLEFIEKLINLPVLLPRLRLGNRPESQDGKRANPLREFIAQILGMGPDSIETVLEDTEPSKSENNVASNESSEQRSIPTENSGTKNSRKTSMENDHGEAPKDIGAGSPSRIESESEIPTFDQEKEASFWDAFPAKDKDRETHSLLRMAAPALGYSPRLMRQFVMLLRLRARIIKRCTQFHHPGAHPDVSIPQLGKFVAISLRWPLLISDLVEDPKLLKRLVTWVDDGRCKDPQNLWGREQWFNKQELLDLLQWNNVVGKQEKDRYSMRNFPIERIISTLPPPSRVISSTEQQVRNKEVSGTDNQSDVGDLHAPENVHEHTELDGKEVAQIVDTLLKNASDSKVELARENDRLKQDLSAAIQRAEQAESKGLPEARDVLKTLYESGDSAKLLEFLISRRNAIGVNIPELNREIAAVAYLMGQIDTAETALKAILSNNPDDVDAINRMGHINLLRGNLDGAVKAYSRVLEIADKRNDEKGQAIAYGNLGSIYQTRGELDKAEQMHRKSLEISERLGRQEGMANQYGNLGLIYRTRGELDKAEEMIRKSLEIAERLGLQEGMANQYGNLGLIYETRGDLDKAEQMYRKSLEIEERLGRQEGMANQYGNLGNIDQTRGDLDKAELMHHKSLEIEETLGRQEGMANQYGNLGRIYRTRGDLDKAEQMLRKSLEIDQRLGRQEGMAKSYGNLGVIFEQRGQTDKAREVWTKARNIYAKIGAHHMADKLQGLLDELDKKQSDDG